MKNLLLGTLSMICVLSTNNLNAQCTAPVNLASSWSNNISTFTWDTVPGAIEYYFELDWAGGSWGFGEYLSPTNSYQFANLMQGGAFQWRVRANCASGSSAYSPASYTTPCVEPFNLSTTNITTNSAVLNWQQSSLINNNNTGYSVSYRQANPNNAWIQLTNIYNNPTATFFNLTGLLPQTAYEWRVRRVCSAINSNYITSQFVTLGCISNGNNANEWINLFSLGTINRTSGAEPGGYANVASTPTTSTNLVIGSTNNAGQIRAGFSGNSRNERFTLFIDFNRNGSFADAGERLLTTNNETTMSGTNIKNFNITIPSNVTAGPTRMRVLMSRNSNSLSNSCSTGYNGETEDFNVNIITSGSRIASSPAMFANKINDTEQDHSYSLMALPNPSTGIFTINMQDEFKPLKYVVTNTMGMVVKEGMLNGASKYKVNLLNAPKGIYILTVFGNDKKTQTTKLIVQ